MKNFFYPLFLILLAVNNLSAQNISQSRFLYLPETKEFIDISLPPDTKSERPENCVGRLIECDRSFFNNAEDTQVDGGTLWRIGISSNGASSLSIDFKNITLAKGVELCLYGGNDFVGMFTDSINNDRKSLRTRFVDNDSVIVELFVPQNVVQNDFTINKVSYGFYPVAKMLKGGRGSGKCAHPDINGQYGINYQKEKHAVIQYQFDSEDYTYVCTGALVNNVNQDATPYILTAAHCVCRKEEAETVVSYFNFELASDGYSSKGFQTLMGAELIAYPTRTYQKGLRDTWGSRIDEGEYNDYDISLLKLSEIPPKSYLPYYLGITLNTKDNIESVATIHHPNGNEKAIALSNMPPYQDSYPISDEVFVSNVHWHVDTWYQGYTEVGSSGAPLLNQKKQLIGVLSGGFATCQEPYDDYFQMISKVWNTNPNPNHQLSYWLANSSDITEIEPFDPYGLYAEYPVAVLAGEWNNDSTKIILEWLLSANADAPKPDLYRVYCNGDVIEELTPSETNNYTFSKISPKSIYTFYIESIFNAQSTSTRSNGLVLSNFVTPLPSPDPVKTPVTEVVDNTSTIIYPNPTKNKVNILCNNNLGECTVTIISLSGQIVKTLKANIHGGIPSEIDLTNIKSGIYIISIGNAYKQQIVVE